LGRQVFFSLCLFSPVSVGSVFLLSLLFLSCKNRRVLSFFSLFGSLSPYFPSLVTFGEPCLYFPLSLASFHSLFFPCDCGRVLFPLFPAFLISMRHHNYTALRKSWPVREPESSLTGQNIGMYIKGSPERYTVVVPHVSRRRHSINGQIHRSTRHTFRSPSHPTPHKLPTLFLFLNTCQASSTTFCSESREARWSASSRITALCTFSIARCSGICVYMLT